MGLAGALAPAAQADVATGDSVYVGKNAQGYGGTRLFPIYETTPADPANPGTPDYWAYCIEHNVSAKTGLHATVGDVDSFLGDNLFTDNPDVQSKIRWVLAHSYPAVSLEELAANAGLPSISVNDAVEATQYAIWRYTDLGWDAGWNFETPDSGTAYWYLVNGANASSGLQPSDLIATVKVTAPTAEQNPGTLVGPFVIDTNAASAAVTADPDFVLTDQDGDPINASAVTDGQSVYVKVPADTQAEAVTVTATAKSLKNTGFVLSVPTADGNTATKDSHGQSIILVTPSTNTVSDSARATWKLPTVENPVIGTTLVDSADQDHVLPWNGGTVVDTVTYKNLTPGTEYTVTGELMLKDGETATGIKGQTTFTPTEANGTVDVTFTIPEGFSGKALVAYETLYEGNAANETPIAEHKDINDASQTVTVEEQPTTATPTTSAPSTTPATEPSTSSTPATTPASTPNTTQATTPATTVESTSPNTGGLANTGFGSGGWLVLAALGTIAGGLILLSTRRAKHS
ncbi:MAG: VaFE repeat-containing surface-anchored protein [Arthrobacter sp.]|nr:VaFE repeat-containing surface-anchored protein [Arthrobacter sp.]